MRAALSAALSLALCCQVHATRGGYDLATAVKQSQTIVTCTVRTIGDDHMTAVLQIGRVLKGKIAREARVTGSRYGKPAQVRPLKAGRRYLVFLCDDNTIRFRFFPLQIEKDRVRCCNSYRAWCPLEGTLKHIQDLVAPDLARLIDDAKAGDATVRCYSLRVLGHLGPAKAGSALPAIIQAMREENSDVRLAAIWAAGEFGPAAKDAVPALIQILRDRPNGYWYAAGALAKIGPDAQAAVPELVRMLKDGSSRIWAAMGLGGIRSEKAVPALIEALDSMSGIDRDWVTDFDRSACASALGRIGAKAESAIPSLLAALEDGDAGTRSSAARALGQIGSEKAVAGLIRALKDEHQRVREAASWSLAHMACEDAVPALIEALRDTQHTVRAHSARGLGRIGSRKAIAGLTEALEDRYPAVRKAASEALKQIRDKKIPSTDE